MTTANLQHVKHAGFRLMQSALRGLTTGIILTVSAAVAAGDDSYQQNALFNPSATLLKAEFGGRVTIYDQLDNDVVERALDEQFGRIENMMFTRIRHPRPDGEVVIEDDDGC